ncbi:MAG: uroporphyrinogen decarboxylase family protein [Cellulosilyticaceae bacterium]
MTERERFIKALNREPLQGHVPHFELVFFLTMESIGRIHPSHRHYGQWNQMTLEEKKLHLRDMALSYIEIAEKYNHSAIFVHPNPGDRENVKAILEEIRELSGDKYFLMMHGDPTYSIPDGDGMWDFSAKMYEEPEILKEGAKRQVENAKAFSDYISQYKGLLDGFALCSDYCFNVNPFFNREMFGEFVQPYLAEIIKYYREQGFYTIKHTDGNIMPIADMMVDCQPHALHSLDPQGGVSLAEMKKLYGDKVCLIGNVNCGLLQTGTEEQLEEEVRRSLREGMEGYGYIFSTSNCAYTGLPLDRYEKMHKIWRKEGIYK